MIITVNAVAHSVDIENRFRPTYIRALQFITSMSGKTAARDRTSAADKYECEFKIIGDSEDILDLIRDIKDGFTQALIDTEGGKIFGTGVDHSGVFTCSILNSNKLWPVRDKLTSTVSLKVRVVSPIVYDASISILLPDLFYQWPVNRVITEQKTNFQSIEVGDFGMTTKVDIFGDAISQESVKVKLSQDDARFGQLHRFIADKRGDSFLLTTTDCLKLFTNGSSNNVIITKFTYRPLSFANWEVELTMVNNV